MIEPVITVLEVLANAKSLLDIAAFVSRYVKRKSSLIQPNETEFDTSLLAEKQQGLEATLNEWKHIATVVEPSIGREIRQQATTSLAEQADTLAKLAEQYASVKVNYSHSDLDHILLRHTKVIATPEGNIQLLLGQSDRTSTLRGDVINIPSAVQQAVGTHKSNGDKMGLPVFKVTMLGDSGAGKTVFMASMYMKLREAPRGIAIRALDDKVDRELNQIMKELYLKKNWPPGTEVNEKKYDFELLLGKHAVAQIDWVDYRGGALFDSSTEETQNNLIKRLQDSHAIIWMVDMSQIGGLPLNSTHARLITGVGQMAHLCRQAFRADGKYRSILFVRTKSDEVLDNHGKPDLEKACSQLIEHLGRDNFSDIPCSAVIPISSSGKVDTHDKPVGDDPSNVEWPLILSLAFLLEYELRGLKQEADKAYLEMKDACPSQVVGFFKELVGAPPSAKLIQATHSRDTLTLQVAGLREIIEKFLTKIPSSIKGM